MCAVVVGVCEGLTDCTAGSTCLIVLPAVLFGLQVAVSVGDEVEEGMPCWVD